MIISRLAAGTSNAIEYDIFKGFCGAFSSKKRPYPRIPLPQMEVREGNLGAGAEKSGNYKSFASPLFDDAVVKRIKSDRMPRACV